MANSPTMTKTKATLTASDGQTIKGPSPFSGDAELERKVISDKSSASGIGKKWGTIAAEVIAVKKAGAPSPASATTVFGQSAKYEINEHTFETKLQITLSFTPNIGEGAQGTITVLARVLNPKGGEIADTKIEQTYKLTAAAPVNNKPQVDLTFGAGLKNTVENGVQSEEKWPQGNPPNPIAIPDGKNTIEFSVTVNVTGLDSSIKLTAVLHGYA